MSATVEYATSSSFSALPISNRLSPRTVPRRSPTTWEDAPSSACPVAPSPSLLTTSRTSSSLLDTASTLTRTRPTLLATSVVSPHLILPRLVLSVSRTGYGNRPRKVDDIPLDDDDEDDLPSGSADVTQLPISKQSRITLDCLDHHAINFDLIVSLLENLCFYRQDLIPFSSAILIFLPSLESIRRLTDTLEAHNAFGTNQFLILPLHSTISNENQGLVFNVPRAGIRKIVISTYVSSFLSSSISPTERFHLQQHRRNRCHDS